ncbi:MAG: SDR family oxidoreductase [Alphaproteobacteria bacterium]|nr:SDR family oxidoreductase [Alphaproteobacteria bacterium]
MRDRRILVTGGASGIGKACVDRLAALGARPIVADRMRASDGLAADDDGHLGLRLDVLDADAVERAVAAIEDSQGPLDGLVNAAGILQRTVPPTGMDMAEWDRVVGVDLRGSYVACRAVGSRMAERGRGAIVNIASISGMTSGPLHAYGPAKAGVIQLTSTLAGEWGRRGVRVNCVSPGFTETPALRKGFDKGVLREDKLTAATALGRLVRATEIAAAVAWLLSDDAGAITGINLPVDAGFLCGVTWPAYGGIRGATA